MNPEIKRKLEAEEKRHNEEMKRILAEKESGWVINTIEILPEKGVLGNFMLTSNFCFSSESKAKEYAAKAQLWLRMEKECDENGYDEADIFSLIRDIIIGEKVPTVTFLGMDSSEAELIKKFGEEILKIWVRGEYEN